VAGITSGVLLEIKRSGVPPNDFGQVVYTHVSLSPSSLVPAKRRVIPCRWEWDPRPDKTDLVVSAHQHSILRQGNEHPTCSQEKHNTL